MIQPVLILTSAIVLVSNVFANDAEFGRIISFDNFDHFRASMNKSYEHDHIEKRARAAYEENTRRIREHNEAAQQGKYSFEIRANSMADLSHTAYLRQFVRLRENVHPQSKKQNATDIDDDDREALLGSIHRVKSNDQVIPHTLDWRKLGFQTGSYNQMTCGSCYAFSIATSIEAQIFKRTGKLVPMSAQQIVDCSVDMGNGGCHGGTLKTTFKYLQTTRGLMRSVDYPYQSAVNSCSYKPSLAIVNVTSWALLPRKDEDAMVKAIALVGPIPISINAATRTFQLYSHGIYDDPECTDDSVNHAMLAVGYTPDYFILQNWWGDKWGENGYMKIRRNRNMCGLSNYGAYAMV